MDSLQIAQTPVRRPTRTDRAHDDLEDSWFGWKIPPAAQEPSTDAPDLGDPLADEWFRKGQPGARASRSSKARV